MSKKKSFRDVKEIWTQFKSDNNYNIFFINNLIKHFYFYIDAFLVWFCLFEQNRIK